MPLPNGNPRECKVISMKPVRKVHSSGGQGPEGWAKWAGEGIVAELQASETQGCQR